MAEEEEFASVVFIKVDVDELGVNCLIGNMFIQLSVCRTFLERV